MITVTMAFNTVEINNRLTGRAQSELLTGMMKANGKLNGATLTEHMRTYRMDNGDIATEYGYTIDFYQDAMLDFIKDYFVSLAKQHNQESIIVNDDFIYLNGRN